MARTSKAKRSRDIEKAYPRKQFVAKLRRLADSLEKDTRFAIQVHRERIFVPAHAIVNIEHEREGNAEEVEFQIKWSNEPAGTGRSKGGNRKAKSRKSA